MIVSNCPSIGFGGNWVKVAVLVVPLLRFNTTIDVFAGMAILELALNAKV